MCGLALKCLNFARFNVYRVDLVLLSGDIANLSDKTYGTAPLEEVEKHDKFLEQIVKQLSTIATVYYIPGNVSAMPYVHTDSTNPQCL